jgi:hypothetical protein
MAGAALTDKQRGIDMAILVERTFVFAYLETIYQFAGFIMRYGRRMDTFIDANWVTIVFIGSVMFFFIPVIFDLVKFVVY